MVNIEVCSKNAHGQLELFCPVQGRCALPLSARWQAVSLGYDLTLKSSYSFLVYYCARTNWISFICFPGNCSRGWNECIQGPEGGIHGYYGVPCCSAASLPADLDHHCFGEELHHRLPIAHKHAAGPCGCKALARVGGVGWVFATVNVCSTEFPAFSSLWPCNQSGFNEEPLLLYWVCYKAYM